MSQNNATINQSFAKMSGSSTTMKGKDFITTGIFFVLFIVIFLRALWLLAWR